MPRAPIPRTRRRSYHSQPRSPGQNKSTRAVQTPGGFLVPPRARRSPGGKRARPSQNLARCETRLQSSITVSTTEHYTGTFGHDGYSYDNDIPQRSGSSHPPERSCTTPRLAGRESCSYIWHPHTSRTWTVRLLTTTQLKEFGSHPALRCQQQHATYHRPISARQASGSTHQRQHLNNC